MVEGVIKIYRSEQTGHHQLAMQMPAREMWEDLLGRRLWPEAADQHPGAVPAPAGPTKPWRPVEQAAMSLAAASGQPVPDDARACVFANWRA